MNRNVKSCLRCVEACPTNSHLEVSGNHQVNFNSCNLSGECISVCPNDALKIIGEKLTIDEVMRIVLKDKEYYKNSGGGLTLSGGEPTAQFKFTLELLKSAKRNNIHTAVETCGFVSPEKFNQIAEFVDLFIYDYKETNVENHTEFTGESNELILQNLRLLNNLGSKILIRCPIIPGYNDRNDHFEGIASIAAEIKNLYGIELMPYHDIGRDKRKNLGLPELPMTPEIPTEETKKEWLEILKSYNCKKVKVA